MRRVSGVDVMLLSTVLLWALNITVTRYVVDNGFHPLAYGTIRYFAAILLFWCFTWWRERSFRIARSDFKLILLAAFFIFMNQISFVTSVHLTSATTVGLVLGTTPIFVGIIATLVGLERLGSAFWIAAVVSFVGVGLIAAGASSGVGGSLLGNALAVATAATWAAYSVTVAPLMKRYSPFRISSLVLAIGWVPLAFVSIPQIASQSFDSFGWTMAFAFAFAVVGPLFLTNLLWFTAIDRVGPSRAALFANLEPFFAVLFAVLLLSEHLSGWEIAGGVAIGVGILIERRGQPEGEPLVVLGE
ncbi:MAG TPA: DMT family transporter [Gaiellaceae bacterium]|nr:DMT family transporter [Gaiellaceae bacterium]